MVAEHLLSFAKLISTSNKNPFPFVILRISPSVFLKTRTMCLLSILSKVICLVSKEISEL